MRIPAALCIATCVLFLLPACSDAQIAAYLTYSPTDFLFFNASSNSQTSNGIVNGAGVGVMFDHLHEGRFVTAVDLKGAFNLKTHIQGGLGAVDYRVAFVPHRVPLKPFFQLGVGIVSVHDPNSGFVATPSTTDAGLDVALGLDIRVSNAVDIRIEDEADAPFKSGSESSPSIGASILNLGAVYHFTRRAP